jgi:signal transduction histidine kinase
MRSDRDRWPFSDRQIDILWAAFAVANLVAMIVFPAWETVPFHFIWVSLTIVYGFRVWTTKTTVWTLAVVILLTGTAIANDIVLGAQPLDEITEVPLMAAMFVAMVWHARRRLAATEEVERVSDANRRLLEREKRFVQDASHQLRTPITIALGHAELIERGSVGQTGEDAHVVVEELLRLRRLADLLLAIAAGDEGRLSKLADIQVDAIVAETVQRWAPTARDWGTDQLESATTVGDPDQLQLALDALIENAVAHTDPGDAITLGVHRRKGSIVVTVADGGVGIDGRDLDRIFDRFERSSSGSPRNARGLGLGLSMVKSVVESHGGRVAVRSSPGEGSVFELVLPELRLPPAEDLQPTVGAAHTGKATSAP